MSSNLDEIVVVIPAYNPDDKLIITVDKILEAGFTKVIIVNDGSKESCKPIFSQVEDKILSVNTDNIVLKHSVNLGQGRAYKTAFNYYIEKFKDTIGVVQCDADGQHHIEDVLKCAELLSINPQKFILGVRNFDSEGIPFRSRFGNKCTSFVFKYFCEINTCDTQSGLKGIPYEACKYLMEAPGERYEYASSTLLEMKKRNIEMLQFEMQTIYINGNESSHFNPIIDSIRIYSLIFKYILSALSAFIVDIVFFTIFLSIFKRYSAETYIYIATYMAKIISCTYSFCVNRRYVFDTNEKMMWSSIKYMILCIVQASVSSILVNFLFSITEWYEVLIKCMVDVCLFFVSFSVQQRWVFKKKENKA